MKKIFILAYAKANVGDDLFIYMLIEKYKNVHFYINIKEKEHQRAFEKYPNITIISEKERELTKQNATDFDGYIYVGGSIFMEGGVVYNITNQFLEFLKECNKNNIPFFYVSSNFGPYYTEGYVNLAKEVFNEISDICFRDKYSYNMFKDIKSVRYAPDLAFAYENKFNVQEKNTVGISIIDLDIRSNIKSEKDVYFKLMRETIKNYIDNNKKVYLFSFCRYEGDEKAINELLENMPNKYLENIHKVLYRGDLEEFLSIYSKMEYMICTRFHAMILSIVFKQKCYILSYSEKINNVIDDLSLFEYYIEFKQIDKYDIISLNKYQKVDENTLLDISNQAKNQLRAFHNFICEE